MKQYFEHRQELNEAFDKYSRTAANRKLKYTAWGFIAAAIVLLLVAAFMMDQLSWEAVCIMRGCAGVFAVIFVVLIGILVYRTNSAYWQNRHTPGSEE